MKELEKTLSTETILSSENVAEDMDKKDLQWLGCYVYDGYETDEESRADWRDKQEDWMNLALQVREDKTFPWPNAANVKYPLLTTAAIQFASRAYPALIPGTEIVKGRVIGFDPTGEKLARAQRIGKHMSYQLLEKMPDWEEEMDKLCISLPILGTLFKKTYYDPNMARNVSELIYPKDLVVNYWTKDLETAPRITHLLEFSRNDIYERQTAGLYLDIDLDELEQESEASEQNGESKADGMTPPPSQDPTNPYCFLEQHLYFDLDGDGYEEPYIVTIDKKTKKVFRVIPRYDQESITWNATGDKIQKIKPEEYFTKFGFVPNPDGSFYDIGFGVLLGPINETVNTLINLLTDAGTISNLQAGFLGKGVRIKGGNKNFEPGEWKTVQTTGDDLRKSIVPLPTREPSNVLFILLELMINSGERLASVTDMLLGENPGQNQPATTSMAVLEQGLKVFTSIYKRLYRSLKKEYAKLFILNSKYLPMQEYFMVLDPGQERGDMVYQKDYSPNDMDVRPAADPNIATETKRLLQIRALGELLALGTINPIVYTRRALEAQGQEGIQELMTMPPPGPPPPEVVADMEAKQDESLREWAKINIQRQTANDNSLKSETAAMLNVAKAEASAVGQQIELYKAELERIKTGIGKYNEETGEIEEPEMEEPENANSSGQE